MHKLRHRPRRVTYLRTLFLIFGAFWLSENQGLASSLTDKIKASVRANQNIPDVGVAVLVLDQGATQTVLMGYRDRENRLPVTESTTFVLGSLSKAFTAFALKQSEEAQRISLKTPLRNFLTGFKLSDPIATKEANLEDLLSHRTGLPRHDAFWYLSLYDAQALFSRLWALPGDKEGNLQFQKSYQYNNLMYGVAGAALAQAGKKSWESVIRTQILEPLKMNSTTTDLNNFIQRTEAARGYWDRKQLPYKNVTSINGAAGLNSSLKDLTKWLELWIGEGQSSSGAILSRSGIRDLLTPRIETAAGSKSFYALGWRVGEVNGVRYVRHGGNMDGFLSQIGFLPDQKKGYIILTNQNDTPVVSSVAQTIIESWVGTTRNFRGYEEETRIGTDLQLEGFRVPVVGRSFLNSAYGEAVYAVTSKERTISLQGHVWPVKNYKVKSPTSAEGTITVDMGGRYADFVVPFVLDSSGSALRFSIQFEERSLPFVFEGGR